MNADKQVQEKKRLIRWFLLTRQLKKPEVARLLRWFLFNERLLYQTTLTTDDASLPNLLMISDHDSTGHPFFYRRQQEFYYDVDQVVQLLEEDYPERLYLNLNCCNQNQEQISLCCTETVVYDYQNPDNACEKKYNKYVSGRNKKTAIKKVFQVIARDYQDRQQKKNYLWQQIDNSLDQRDQQKFARLVEELQKLA